MMDQIMSFIAGIDLTLILVSMLLNLFLILHYPKFPRLSKFNYILMPVSFLILVIVLICASILQGG